MWAAGCPYIDRLSTDDGRFRVLRKVVIPFQTPLTAESTRYPLRDMAIGEGALWVLGDPLDRRVWRVDEHTGQIDDDDIAAVRATFDRGRRRRRVGHGIDRRCRRPPRSGNGQIVQIIPVDRGASGVAVGAGGRVGGERAGGNRLAHRPGVGSGRCDDPRGRRPAGDRRRRRQGLGDRRCRVDTFVCPFAAIAVALVCATALGCGGQQLIRSGSAFSRTARGRSAGCRTAQLSGAELPFLQRGARSGGQGAGRRRDTRRRWGDGRSSSSRDAPRRASTRSSSRRRAASSNASTSTPSLAVQASSPET